MDFATTAVAEELAAEFPDGPARVMIRAVADCGERFSNGDPLFIEQGAGSQMNRGGELAP